MSRMNKHAVNFFYKVKVFKSVEVITQTTKLKFLKLF